MRPQFHCISIPTNPHLFYQVAFDGRFFGRGAVGRFGA